MMERTISFLDARYVEVPQRQPFAWFVAVAFLDLAQKNVSPIDEAPVVLDLERFRPKRAMQDVQRPNE
jgi:hypothetical protein